jgi:hypothetical protein
MQHHQIDQETILREKLIYRYVQAMDHGEAEEIAAVLEAALDDPELDRIITEIDLAYQEEEQLTPIAQDAELVRKLIREHLPSAFEIEETEDKPLTVGDVAARLQVDRRVPSGDQEVNHLLLGSSVPLPIWLNARAIKKLATELGVTASERFWQAFRDTAIMLGMSRPHNQAQLLAAREERARYTTHKKERQTGLTLNKTSDKEEDR